VLLNTVGYEHFCEAKERIVFDPTEGYERFCEAKERIVFNRLKVMSVFAKQKSE
jgi:hypothetical protein